MDALASSTDVSRLGAEQSKTGIANEKNQDRFLKLLVSQMKNQDPLNPLDNAQVTTQLAQISTVSGLEQLNATLSTLLSQVTASQSLEAAALIGRGVLAPGERLTLQDGKALFGIELPQAADQVVLTIRDAAGLPIHTVNLGPQSAGAVPLNWDGRADNGIAAADGQYSFTVSAEQGGKAVSAQTLTFGRVDGVVREGETPLLQLAGGGRIAVSEVKQIL